MQFVWMCVQLARIGKQACCSHLQGLLQALTDGDSRDSVLLGQRCFSIYSMPAILKFGGRILGRRVVAEGIEGVDLMAISTFADNKAIMASIFALTCVLLIFLQNK